MGRRLMVLAGAVAAAALCLSGASAGRKPPPDPGYAVAYQVDAAHDGVQAATTLTPPLAQRWATSFPGKVSYPLIAEGKVFVTVASVGSYGTTLYALAQSDGHAVWSAPISGTYFWSAAAYDAGTVFVLNTDGLLRAYAAATGAPRWAVQLPGQYSFSSAPTAAGGVVYVGGAGSGGTLYAVRESDGQVLWTRSVANGDESSPALSPSGVFVSYAGPQVYGFDRASGAQLWRYQGASSGGGGKTAVVSGGRLLTRDFALNGVFDAASGTLLGTFAGGTAPAVAGGVAYQVAGGALSALDLSSFATRWSVSAGFTSAPLVVPARHGSNVWVGSSTGTLSALDAATGKSVWSASVGAPVPAPDEQNVSQPLTGLAAGQGLLVVPAGTLLVAYG